MQQPVMSRSGAGIRDVLAAACVVAEADGLIFGLLLAGIGRDEIARTLHIDIGELETRQWTMLRKLERLD